MLAHQVKVRFSVIGKSKKYKEKSTRLLQVLCGDPDENRQGKP